jgi:zinc transporter 5/7
VGVIVSTILIKWTGWSGFDPLASIFIALLIVASVVPLVIDSGRILCLDVGEGKEKEIRDALAEVSSPSKVVSLQVAFIGRGFIQLRLSSILASL